MTELTQRHFYGIPLHDINNYLGCIEVWLNERIPISKYWQASVKNLRNYFNAHDFVKHEGTVINDDTVDKFLNRIQTENNNDNLNFLSVNKLEKVMLEPEPEPVQVPVQTPINPLEKLISRDISVQDLLGIYNTYAPNPITTAYLRQQFNDNVDEVKAFLLDQILTHARDGTLVSRGFGKSSDRIGMTDLAKIVLDLQRDVKRVKSAISPQGAEALVVNHNAKAGPSAQWKLNKQNPQAPASLRNLTDINNDGIPDVVITNANGQPIFVNGYTTTKSTYPVDLAYYNQYPTRASRSGHSYNAFKKELFNVKYDTDNVDFSKRGNFIPSEPNGEYLQGYNLNIYKPPTPKRMSSFNRFKKFIVGPYIDNLLKQLNIPSSYKLAASSKACAAAWNEFILQPLYDRYSARSDAEKARIKKKAAVEIDEIVNTLFYKLTQTTEDWTKEQRTAFEERFINTLGAEMETVIQE